MCRWRTTSFTPQSVPFAPKMNFGRRGSNYVKGVYFGNPGMPRCSYPSTRMDPGLGPSLGLAKFRPPPKAEKFDVTTGNHLHSTPASFILEGVVGFNPNTAREIRELRRQLASVEELYEESVSRLQDAMSQSQQALRRHKESLVEADLRREDLSRILEARRQHPAALIHPRGSPAFVHSHCMQALLTPKRCHSYLATCCAYDAYVRDAQHRAGASSRGFSPSSTRSAHRSPRSGSACSASPPPPTRRAQAPATPEPPPLTRTTRDPWQQRPARLAGLWGAPSSIPWREGRPALPLGPSPRCRSPRCSFGTRQRGRGRRRRAGL